MQEFGRTRFSPIHFREAYVGSPKVSRGQFQAGCGYIPLKEGGTVVFDVIEKDGETIVGPRYEDVKTTIEA